MRKHCGGSAGRRGKKILNANEDILKVSFQELCAKAINDYCITGEHRKMELMRRCYEAFKSLDSYKDYWYLKPWIVGLMVYDLGYAAGVASQNKKPRQCANIDRAATVKPTTI